GWLGSAARRRFREGVLAAAHAHEHEHRHEQPGQVGQQHHAEPRRGVRPRTDPTSSRSMLRRLEPPARTSAASAWCAEVAKWVVQAFQMARLAAI
ncbi:MAG TPA: hypothetical protein VE258_03075, partial [Ktedonobacterales bacterium]|nr:hypothetical protein [Ktedonobacterales bacterium]